MHKCTHRWTNELNKQPSARGSVSQEFRVMRDRSENARRRSQERDRTAPGSGMHWRCIRNRNVHVLLGARAAVDRGNRVRYRVVRLAETRRQQSHIRLKSRTVRFFKFRMERRTLTVFVMYFLKKYSFFLQNPIYLGLVVSGIFKSNFF